jgi:hypothetical protein
MIGAGVADGRAGRSGSTRSRGVDRDAAVARFAGDSRPAWTECSISESWISNSKAPGRGVARSNDSHAVRRRRIERDLTVSLYLGPGDDTGGRHRALAAIEALGSYGFLQITFKSA